jgi:F-type H+-transporting ATPase subunit b
MLDESFWVAVAFFLFLGVLVYFKVPALLAKILDERASRIRKQLEEAGRLREEAQALFAEYQRKHRRAMQDAHDILTHAESEAERLREAAEAELKVQLARRRQLAETRIQQAEAAAVREVRDAAVDLAIAAAGNVLREDLKGPADQALIEKSLDDVRRLKI